MRKFKGLIVTVGQDAQPIVVSLHYCEPSLVVFLVTETSRMTLDRVVGEYALQPSQYLIEEFRDDPREMVAVLRAFKRGLSWLEQRGVKRGEIVVDFTPGRKWMSTALVVGAGALRLAQWYLPVLDSGASGEPVSLGSLLEEAGMTALAQFAQAFNEGHYGIALSTLQQLQCESLYGLKLKEGFNALTSGYQDWDHFRYVAESEEDRHRKAGRVLRCIRRGAEALKIAARERTYSTLDSTISCVEMNVRVMEQFCEIVAPHPLISADIIENARRRIKAGHYDDAVARLYRATESVIQYALKASFGLESDGPDWAGLTEDQKNRLHSYFEQLNGSGCLPDRLQLTSGLAVLYCLGDETGRILGREEDGKVTSVLSDHLQKRNSSVLAHGFRAASRDDATSFLEALERHLGKLSYWPGEEELAGLCFPHLDLDQLTAV